MTALSGAHANKTHVKAYLSLESFDQRRKTFGKRTEIITTIVNTTEWGSDSKGALYDFPYGRMAYTSHVYITESEM